MSIDNQDINADLIMMITISKMLLFFCDKRLTYFENAVS